MEGKLRGRCEQGEFACLGEESRKPTETGNGGSGESLQLCLKRWWEPGTERNGRGGGLLSQGCGQRAISCCFSPTVPRKARHFCGLSRWAGVHQRHRRLPQLPLRTETTCRALSFGSLLMPGVIPTSENKHHQILFSSCSCSSNGEGFPSSLLWPMALQRLRHEWGNVPAVETGTSTIPLAILCMPGEGLPPVGRRLANADRPKSCVGAGVLH